MVDPLKNLPKLGDDAMNPCAICRRQLLETGLPLFYRFDIRQCGLDRGEISRHVGLAMTMGGGRDGLALAGVLGPKVEPVVVLNERLGVNLCHDCAMKHAISFVPQVFEEEDNDADQD